MLIRIEARSKEDLSLPETPDGSNIRSCCAESLYQLSCQMNSEKQLIEAGAVEVIFYDGYWWFDVEVL